MNALEQELVMTLLNPPGSQFQRGYLARVMQDYERHLKRKKSRRGNKRYSDWLRAECRRVLAETEDAPGLEEWLEADGGATEAPRNCSATVPRETTSRRRK